MKASLFYLMASVLLLLFAIGHTFGFRRSQPEWRVAPVITSMRETHFVVGGFRRSYWHFYVGFGLFVSVLLLFAALVAWQLGSLPADTLARMKGIVWALPASFVVVTILSYRYFFIIPIVLRRNYHMSDRSSVALGKTKLKLAAADSERLQPLRLFGRAADAHAPERTINEEGNGKEDRHEDASGLPTVRPVSPDLLRANDLL